MMNVAMDTTLFDPAQLDTGEPLPRTAYRDVLRHAREVLFERFKAGDDIQQLVSQRAGVIDQVLAHAWKGIGLADHPDIALLAVGGYGRSELHPGSDIDVLILHDQRLHDGERVPSQHLRAVLRTPVLQVLVGMFGEGHLVRLQQRGGRGFGNVVFPGHVRPGNGQAVTPCGWHRGDGRFVGGVTVPGRAAPSGWRRSP